MTLLDQINLAVTCDTSNTNSENIALLTQLVVNHNKRIDDIDGFLDGLSYTLLNLTIANRELQETVDRLTALPVPVNTIHEDGWILTRAPFANAVLEFTDLSRKTVLSDIMNLLYSAAIPVTLMEICQALSHDNDKIVHGIRQLVVFNFVAEKTKEFELPLFFVAPHNRVYGF